MAEEFENKEGLSSEQKDANREGYSPAGQAGASYQRDYHAGRPQRPRIRTQRAYSSDHSSNDEGGFRPEGFGAGLQNNGATQRPSNGYQPRGGYQPRQGGYRPRYNNDNQEGGYQPRQGGYRPRYNNDGQ